MASGPQDVNWSAIGVMLTFIGGVWVTLKSFFSFATRKEMAEAIDKLEKARTESQRQLETRVETGIHQMESRADVKFDEIRKTMLMLHEDNRHARHDLRDSLNAPILQLGTHVQQLREFLQRQADD